MWLVDLAILRSGTHCLGVGSTGAVFYYKTKPPLWWFLFCLNFLVFENQQRWSLLGEKSSASEQSAKDFSLGETKFLKRKAVGTFNASAARQPGEFFSTI